jgi:hypothetical protein
VVTSSSELINVVCDVEQRSRGAKLSGEWSLTGLRFAPRPPWLGL